jgi:hypothetical protein
MSRTGGFSFCRGSYSGSIVYSLASRLPGFVDGAVYRPYGNDARNGPTEPTAMTLVVRTANNPNNLAPELRRIVASINSAVPLTDIQTFHAVVAHVKDEPLVIYTPLFADDDTHKLIDMLMLPTLDVHFFDEHSREWLGYTSSLTCPPVAKDRMKEGRLLPFDLSLAKLAHTQLHQWFGTRTQIDDQDAISIDFRESHFADDLVILDARADNHLHQGGHSFSFSQLEREEPGAFQEQDIAHLLGRLFDPRDIYMNPLRVTDREEIADLLVLTESEMIVVQAKDSPNTERILRNTIARKKATARKALMKAINQVRGALRYMHSTSPFEMILGNIVVPVQIGRRQVRALIVVKELFNDEFGAYSPPILQLSKETGIPCIALDYPELQGYTGMSSREKFFEAFDLVYNHAQKSGELPRMRIWMAGDGGTE